MNSDKACRSCSSRIDNLHDFKHQWQKIEDEDPSLNSAQIIDEGLLDRKKSDIVFHITEVKSMYPTTGNDVQSALMATASDVSDMAFRYRLVDAFVSVLNVIQTMGNSLAVIRVIADFLRRCARSSLCFAILNGHCALVAMLSRSYKEFRQLVIKRDDSQRTSSSYFVSDVFPNKLSPDGYINTTPRHSRDKRTAEIFEKVQVEVHTALVQLICGLSNSYLDTCSCNLDNKDTLLLPLSVDFDILSETQLLSTFSACNLSIHHAQLLLLLTLSGDPLLVQTGAQLCAQLIICNPVNSITIEMAGGVAALVANVKMLLCEVPHLCEGTRETPWLVELGGTTITNNASIKYGFGCTSAKVSTRTQIDHVHAGGFGLHYSKDEIQKSLVFIIRALVVFSAITEIRTSDAILAALMTISHIEVSQALLRGPVGSDQIMFSDTFFEKKYAGQDSSRRYTPVSGALQQPKCYTLIDCQSYSVMCQRCRISKAVSQCTSSICKNNDAHLVCKKCRPPLCIASHLALPIADSEADFPVNWQYVKCKDEPASISVVLEEVFEELMAYPDLMHILLSTYNLANLPVQTPLYYSIDTKYDDDTDVTDVIHKRRMSAFENLFSVQCNTGNILNVFDTETYVQDQWENVVILVAAVKSMCDDKLARGLHIPNFIQVLLLESMKQVFFNPTFISDRPVSTIVERFANLPANAALSSVIFSAKFDCTGSDIEPPNIHQYSLRRILAAILIQCLSRFLTKDRLISIKRTSEFTSNRSVDNYRALRRPDDARRLSDFISLGGPVILVCVIIGSSIVSNDFQLSFEPTLADRQFALWCLRESLVCALSINSGSLAGPISNQLVWLMRSAISPTLNSSEVHSGQNSPIFFSLSSDVADSCITGASFDTPAQCATVPSTIIFLIIQELRILIAGDSLCSDHDLKLMQPMSKILTLSDADEKPTLGMLWSGPFDAVVLKPSLYSVLPNLLQPSSGIAVAQ